MKNPSAATLFSFPLKARTLGWTDLRLYLFSTLFAVGNLLVPLALHSIPEAGPMFLPLFFFTLVAGWQFGFVSGLAVAVVSPVLNHVLVGMPTDVMLPVVLVKSVVLALAAAFLARRFKTVNFPGLLGAVAAMQAVGFLAEQFTGVPLPVSTHLLVLGLPGVALLVVGGYAVLRLLNRQAKE